jgi:transcriptional regulator with XRE-family HTH domain
MTNPLTTPRHLRQLLRMSLGLEELGALIKQAREDANLSQRALADKIDLKDPQSISNYERAITEVPVPRLRRIAEATGKPLSYFIPDAEPSPLPSAAERFEASVVRFEELVDRLTDLLDAREPAPTSRKDAQERVRR